MEVVVGKGDHQGYDNWEDDRKSHGNIRWNDQEVREAIFINPFDHVFEGTWNGNSIVNTFCNCMCIFDICEIKST